MLFRANGGAFGQFNFFKIMNVSRTELPGGAFGPVVGLKIFESLTNSSRLIPGLVGVWEEKWCFHLKLLWNRSRSSYFSPRTGSPGVGQ